jgi:hypothetical protein
MTVHTPPPPAPGKRENRALPAMLLVVSLALLYILLPFYGAIMWGSIIALLFTPLHRWLLPRVGRRPNLAALLTLLIVLLIVVLPLSLIATSLVREAAGVYQRLQSGELKPALYFHGVFDALPNWITAVLDRFGLVSFNTLQRRLTAALTQGTQFIAEQTFSIGQNTFEFVASVFITLYLSFFLIRDGNAVVQAIWATVPLAAVHKQDLLGIFTTVIRATVKGNLLVAPRILDAGCEWRLAVGGHDGLPIVVARCGCGPGVAAGGDLFFAGRCALEECGTGGLWRSGDRIGGQPAASNFGGQGHPNARLRCDDHHIGRHGGIWFERLRPGPSNCRHVHRRLAHSHYDSKQYNDANIAASFAAYVGQRTDHHTGPPDTDHFLNPQKETNENRQSTTA